ncbi:MAG: hypothetical protein NZ902_01045 [Acidilobaceae archaeon]|nr:hypothetical protein [Acidilobaceae archaeon]MDW7973841.1 hypothetical protein [Sulfolobales archaeon]
MASSLDKKTLLLGAALLISIVALSISLLAVAQVSGFRVVQNVPLAGFFAGFVTENPQVQIVNFRVCRHNVTVDQNGNIQARGFAFDIKNVGNANRTVAAMVNVYDAQGRLLATGARPGIVVPANQQVTVIVSLNQNVSLNQIARVVGMVQVPASAGP